MVLVKEVGEAEAVAIGGQVEEAAETDEWIGVAGKGLRVQFFGSSVKNVLSGLQDWGTQ